VHLGRVTVNVLTIKAREVVFRVDKLHPSLSKLFT